jgi:hypothetical protein
LLSWELIGVAYCWGFKLSSSDHRGAPPTRSHNAPPPFFWGGGACFRGGRGRRSSPRRKAGLGGATRAWPLQRQALCALRGLGGSAHGLVVADGLDLGIFFLEVPAALLRSTHWGLQKRARDPLSGKPPSTIDNMVLTRVFPGMPLELLHGRVRGGAACPFPCLLPRPLLFWWLRCAVGNALGSTVSGRLLPSSLGLGQTCVNASTELPVSP